MLIHLSKRGISLPLREPEEAYFRVKSLQLIWRSVVPNPRRSCSNFISVRGYPASSPTNGHQTTLPMENYSKHYSKYHHGLYYRVNSLKTKFRLTLRKWATLMILRSLSGTSRKIRTRKNHPTNQRINENLRTRRKNRAIQRKRWIKRKRRMAPRKQKKRRILDLKGLIQKRKLHHKRRQRKQKIQGKKRNKQAKKRNSLARSYHHDQMTNCDQRIVYLSNIYYNSFVMVLISNKAPV